MKVLRRINIMVIVVTFLVSGISYGQNSMEHFNKGVEYATQGKFKEAKEEFEKATKIAPSDRPPKESLKVIKDVINHKIKRETAIHMLKGTSFANKGMTDKVIEEFNKAIKTDPNYSAIYFNRGIVYAVKGQYDDAISDFSKAIELNPDYVEAYVNRGFVYMVNLKNKKKGCSDWKRACELGLCEKYNLAKNYGDCE